MDQEKLEKLLNELVTSQDETECVEFKLNNSNPEEIGERISGISNSANLHNKESGYLIFGVEDETRKIVGTSYSAKHHKKGNESIEHWLLQMLNPKIDFRIFEFNYNNQNIVLFQIPAATDRPISFRGTEYIRIGSINRKLNEFPEKERKIWTNYNHRSFEKDIAKYDVSSDEIFNLLDYPNYFTLTGQNFPENKKGILQKLEQDKIITRIEGTLHITNLGAILFANNIKQFETISRKAIRVITYKGKSKNETIKEQEGTKGYAIGFQGLVKYINLLVPSNEEIKKAFRVEKKMYPEIAIRELIANALIHQDFYEKGTGPMIEIFEDRIEISNPGRSLIDTERFIDNPPRSRNEILAAFMRRINICEERGSGIDKVVSQVELYQLPAPNFEIVENSTKTTLYSYRTLKEMSKKDKIRACYQHCVLKYISNDFMTNSSLRGRFNIKKENYPMASRIISETIKAQYIKPKDSKYIPIWA